MSHELRLFSYCACIGVLAWVWLLLLLPQATLPFGPLLTFVLLAVLVEGLGLRTPPDDPHSLVGIVLLTAALALGPVPGALAAGISGAIVGVAISLATRSPLTLLSIVGRPVLRSATRILGILLGATLAQALMPNPSLLLLTSTLVCCYWLAVQAGRAGRELLFNGISGLRAWWQQVWRPVLINELLPLPFAMLGALIYTQLPWPAFALAAAALVSLCLALQRSASAMRRQRRSVRELALLNETSRAIIRAELNVTQLCELIYQQASRVVDTSSFHLGLFHDDSYTLVVRVQDRVRKPPLTVPMPHEDGLIGWIKQTRRSLLVHDFDTEMDQLPARPSYQSEHPPRSGIYIPLVAGETVVGSISAQSYLPHAFDAADLRLLSLIADQAAVAIARAQVFAEARERANQLQAIREVSEKVTAILDLDQLLPAVVRLIRERFGYHPVHIYTVDYESGTVVFRASSAVMQASSRIQLRLRLGEGIIGHVASTGKPLLVPDVREEPRYFGDERATLSELTVPLTIGDHVVGVLDVQSDKADDVDESDLFVIKTLASQIAVAIDSANLYALEQEEAWTLNSLLQAAENIARRSNLAELQATIVRLPVLLLGCDRCLLVRWQPEQAQFVTAASYGFDQQQRELLVAPILEEAAPALAELRMTAQPVRIENVNERSNQLPPITDAIGCYALLALPLSVRGNLLGALVVDHWREPHQFGRRQLSLYTSFAGQASEAIERALLAEEAATAGRFEQQLRVAREIQTTLLPIGLPDVPQYDLAATWRSAQIVGGDFYDFWWLRSKKDNMQHSFAAPMHARAVADRLPDSLVMQTAVPVGGSEHDEVPGSLLGFVIADVSDKGVAAALFMSLARSLVRAAALDGSPPDEALARANVWICRDSRSGMFVTVFYGILNPATGELHYSCAGHNPPLLYEAASDTFRPLSTPGIALGVIEEARLNQAHTTLAPGDMLVCYTDGVTEAINAAEEPFDLERLYAAIRAGQSQGAAATIAAITTSMEEFTGGLPQFDDVTLLVVKRTRNA